jgi:hypothetical protein
MSGWDVLELTPVEQRAGMWVKREDLFAPLGPGSINGTKLRQLIRLASDARDAGAAGLVSAASGHSPQLPMTAIVGEHLGLPVHLVTGARSRTTALRSRGVALAVAHGATLEVTLPAYNPVLQRRGRQALEDRPGWYGVPYAISLPEPTAGPAARRFHEWSALQVTNLPSSARTLIMALGSGNSAASVLYGLVRERLDHVERIVLLGIGPSRWEWLVERLELLRADRILERVHFIDLHGGGFVRYADRVRFDLDGLSLHPNYEGKIAAWLDEHPTAEPDWRTPDAVFWNVGSEPRVEPAPAELEPEPTGRPRLVYVIGVPGSGKTTAMRAALSGYLASPRQRPFAHVDYELGEIRMLGRWRDGSSGTDALGLNVQPTVVEWLERLGSGVVVGEGDRLGNRSFLEAVRRLGIETTVVMIDVPLELAESRRVQRGSRQDGAWVRGRITKVYGLSDLVDVRLDGRRDPVALGDELRTLLDAGSTGTRQSPKIAPQGDLRPLVE